MSLSNIFDESKSGLSAFDQTEAAPEFKPLPGGVYRARVVQGEVCQTKSGADAYRIRFEVVEGEQTGRTVQRMWTFSEKARRYTKRDLDVFGLKTLSDLLSPFPPAGKEILVELRVALQQGDNGTQFNDVKSIRVLEINSSAVAEFLIGEDETK